MTPRPLFSELTGDPVRRAGEHARAILDRWFTAGQIDSDHLTVILAAMGEPIADAELLDTLYRLDLEDYR